MEQKTRIIISKMKQKKKIIISKMKQKNKNIYIRDETEKQEYLHPR